MFVLLLKNVIKEVKRQPTDVRKCLQIIIYLKGLVSNLYIKSYNSKIKILIT